MKKQRIHNLVSNKSLNGECSKVNFYHFTIVDFRGGGGDYQPIIHNFKSAGIMERRWSYYN
jgi:hypothetical protein